VVFNQEQQQRVDELMKKFEQAGVNSPAVKESKALAGEGVYEALVELGYLYQLNEEVVYRSVDFEPLVKQIVDYIQTHESAGAAEIRDLLNTSRKYAIALLEYLDQRRITRRVGDERVLLRQPSEF
jgi:selenocysteine-specific elongation factor